MIILLWEINYGCNSLGAILLGGILYGTGQKANTAVGSKKNVAQFCKGRRSEYTRVIWSVITLHVMKITSLETLMNCNVLPIKKHINFYSFGGEFKMRRERHSEFYANWVQNFKFCTNFLKLVSVSKQTEAGLQHSDRCIVPDLWEKWKHNLFSLICICINDLINFVQFKLEHSVTGWVIINSSILN